jgi:phosphohistidine phosphatase
MQHAFAYSAEEDAERPLNPDGVKQAKQSASGIKRLGLVFDLIMTSPKRRAKQTAALVAEQVRYPYSDIMTTEALLPDRAPEELLELLQKESTDSRILIVGHLPHLACLAEALTRGGDLIFENAGLTCLEMSGPKTARLEFHLQAAHLDM